MQTFHKYSYMKCNLLVLWAVASCVAKDLFYENLEAGKSSEKGNSKLTAFIDDEFYQNAKICRMQNGTRTIRLRRTDNNTHCRKL